MGVATPQIVCIGLATRDTIVHVEGYPEPDERVVARELRRAGGGPAATAAVAIARQAREVALAAAVGDDSAGDEIRSGLEGEGVDVRLLTVLAGTRSPESVVLVDAVAGTRSISAYAGTAGGPRPSGELAAAIAEASWVHADHAGYALAKILVRDARSQGARVRFSVDGGNPIRGMDLGGVDLFVPTEAALCRHFGSLSLADAMRAARDEGAGAVVVTRGSRGAAGIGTDVTHFASPGVAMPVMSTLGAGDVFHGVLLCGLLDGLPLEDATHHANVAAALSCAALDGRSAIPDRHGLRAAVADLMAARP